MVQQVTKYRAERLPSQGETMFSPQDRGLIDTYVVQNLTYEPLKHRVDARIYDLNGNLIEHIKGLKEYGPYGALQSQKAKQISLDPVQTSIDYGYRGDVDIYYDFCENVTKSEEKGIKIYIFEISADRSEIRCKCIGLEETDKKTLADTIYKKLNLQKYLPELFLEFSDNSRATVINVMTEVIDKSTILTFKLYEPLDINHNIKDTFDIVEKVGQSLGFRIYREVEILPEKYHQLRGPNFNALNADIESTGTSDYLNFEQLFSLPVSSSKQNLRGLLQDEGCNVSIDFSNFSNFVHFSSISERLLNFRYKIELIQEYEDLRGQDTSSVDYRKYDKLIEGTLSNLDEYEKFLYYESGSRTWPKEDSNRPYRNRRTGTVVVESWWNSIISEAEAYDTTNKDILVSAIPFAIREDPVNEPFIVFTHMIGQHFDDQWVYAKAIADKYKADNRLEYGVSKNLIREVIQDFGVQLLESSQNLEKIFSSFGVDGTFIPGSEASIEQFNRISNHIEDSEGVVLNCQPVELEKYKQEVYKRIYHNLPVLLKSKGTERGLRALINCFGIPDDILKIRVDGISNSSGSFGPRDKVSSSKDKIFIDAERQAPIWNGLEGESASFLESNVMHRDISTVFPESPAVKDYSHKVDIGFGIGEQADQYFKSELGAENFDVDNILGNAGNLEENYGKDFDVIRYRLLNQLREIKGNVRDLFRSPAAIIRLVKYFDSLLYRTAKQFIPARAALSTGVIVEDSILHRNRYAGLNVEGEENRIEAELQVEKFEGSDVGDYFTQPVSKNSECGRTVTVRGTTITVTGSAPISTEGWSTGNLVGTKEIYDLSPLYNGELSGSSIKVLDSEIGTNPMKYAKSNLTTFNVSAIPLDLASTQYTKVMLKPQAKRRLFRQHVEILGEGPIEHVKDEAVPLIVVGTTASFTADSESCKWMEVQSEVLPIFIGWKTGSIAGSGSWYGQGEMTEDQFGRNIQILNRLGNDSDREYTVYYLPGHYGSKHLRVRMRVDSWETTTPGSASSTENVLSFVLEGQPLSSQEFSATIRINYEVQTDTSLISGAINLGNMIRSSTRPGSYYTIVKVPNLQDTTITEYGIRNIQSFENYQPAVIAAGNTIHFIIDADWRTDYRETETGCGWKWDNDIGPQGWTVEQVPGGGYALRWNSPYDQS